MKKPAQHLIAEVPRRQAKVEMTIGIDLGHRSRWSSRNAYRVDCISRKQMSHHKPDPNHELLEAIRDLVGEQRETNKLLRIGLQIQEAEDGFLSDIDLQLKQTSKVAKLIFTGATTMTNDLILSVGQSSTATPVTFLADGVTPAGATISAATYTFSDPSATVVSSDGVTAVITGVAASTGPVSGSVSFTATDTDSAVSQWTVPFTVTTNSVTPPPPSQLSQSAGLTFSIPA